MKKIAVQFCIAVLVACVLQPVITYAQNATKNGERTIHKAVIQVTAGDSLSQASVIAQVKNIRKALGLAQIEVVCHGDGLDMLLKSTSKVCSFFLELKSQDVEFVACQNTMARKKVTSADLCPGVGTVPSAMAEIILKQEDGWAYVKGGH